MGKGANNAEESGSRLEKKHNSKRGDGFYTWKEIQNTENQWVVIKDHVYDISEFWRKHPGGRKILMESCNQDVTDAFTAFHKDMNKVSKYMKTIEIGKVSPTDQYHNPYETDKDEINKDFREIRALAEKMDLFKTNALFFILHFVHIILFDLLGWAIMAYSGYNNWYTYLIATLCLVTAQNQAGWSQHDYGHLSVFQTSKANHFMHKIVIGFIKGVSADWWNYRHFRHHSKPNAHHKDPDIGFGKLLVLGKIIPKTLGLKKKGAYNYSYQGTVFMMLIPPLLLPLVFTFENIVYCWKRKKLGEVLWVVAYFCRFFFQFGPILGGWGTIGLYFLMRFFESHWFVMVTQMNHLPMAVDEDRDLSWFRTQLLTTCNVQQSTFNDWFTGHLNFQIEHHLFPTMPRHNYNRIKPYIQSMCKKHNIEYLDKPLLTAMADIYRELKKSGELWYEAYHL